MQQHRLQLIENLNSYALEYPEEKQTVERFLELLKNHPGCFERNHPKAHITGSAWLLNISKSHVLLTHHRKLNMWLQLGGHADGDENVLSVALKEAREESGNLSIQPLAKSILDIDIHLIPERKGEPEHEHFDVRFLLHTTENNDIEISDESHDLAWVNVEEISTYTNEVSMLRMVAKSNELLKNQINT